ncbi:MAG: single-stranded DNA-binding protein [Aquificaceae bacterium]|nr:single-stranded DNA-binding protein [Aquificaceae bacterium]
MLNKVLIIGRLTRDPTIRYLPSGSQVADFSLAYNRRYMSGETWREESHFFEVKALGKLAESLSTRLSKGYMVLVEGRLVQEKWTDKEGNTQSRVRILADSIRIISKPKAEESSAEQSSEEIYMEDKPFNSEDDEIPF